MGQGVPCLTDIFVETYRPPSTASAVQHECPMTVPNATTYTFCKDATKKDELVSTYI